MKTNPFTFYPTTDMNNYLIYDRLIADPKNQQYPINEHGLQGTYLCYEFFTKPDHNLKDLNLIEVLPNIINSLFLMFTKRYIALYPQAFGSSNDIHVMTTANLVYWIRLITGLLDFNDWSQHTYKRYINFFWWVVPKLLSIDTQLPFSDERLFHLFAKSKAAPTHIFADIYGNISFNARNYHTDEFILKRFSQYCKYLENDAIQYDKLTTKECFHHLTFGAILCSGVRMVDDPNVDDFYKNKIRNHLIDMLKLCV